MGDQKLGIALGAAALVIALFITILFTFIIIMLIIHFNKKLRKMREYLRKERKLREREEGLIEMNPCSPRHFNNSFEVPSPSKPVTVVVHATNQTFAETPLGNQSLPTSPAQAMAPVPSSKAWSDNGQYTDLAGPLPGFLRNEEMLLPPEATPELVAAAQVVNEEEKEEEKKPNEVKDTPVKKGSDDYVNPLDAKTEAAAMRQKEKLKQKVSHGLQQKRTSDPQHSLSITDDGNYTIVSDALPKGDFERIELGNSSSRSRAYSDIDDPKKKDSHVSGADSGKGSNKDSVDSESPMPLKRLDSSGDKPKDLSPERPASEVKSNPIPRRRSMAQHKEEVSFDPNTFGFKLSAKRTNSDGSPALKQKRSDGQNSPVSDPGREFPVGGTTDEGFIEGGVHVYAAVDLKAKCRPEDDILRREGVGAPEHYNAPVTCN